MRKRMKRRRTAPLVHPMLQPVGKLTDAELLDLRLREHLALDALATNCGQRADLRTLLVSVAVARELAALGYGADELAGLDAASVALGPVKGLTPGPIGLDTPAAVQAVCWMLTFHDAQRAAVSTRHYLRALGRVHAQPSRYGIFRA